MKVNTARALAILFLVTMCLTSCGSNTGNNADQDALSHEDSSPTSENDSEAEKNDTDLSSADNDENTDNAQDYEDAVAAFEKKEYEKAQKIFIDLKDYQDSGRYLSEIGSILYSQAQDLYEKGEYAECGDILLLIDESREWAQFQSARDLLATAKKTYIKDATSEARKICKKQGEDEMSTYISGKVCSLLNEDEAKSLKREMYFC